MSVPNPARKNRSLRETIYADLRRQVLSGHLLPGFRLAESSLAESSKVSRTVIRKGIKQPDVEGWVKVTPFRRRRCWPFGQESAPFSGKARISYLTSSQTQAQRI